jgi:hypothetical protein
LSKSRSNFYENDFVGVWCVRGPCRDIGIGTIGQSYRRVSMCSGLPRRRGSNPAYIPQNGPQLNLLNEVGLASRAWPDWFAPATRIWVDRYNYGAVYSPDGITIQFDNGTIWQRDLALPLRRLY